MPLEENSLLALYTDGLINAADHDMEAGLALLREALGNPAGELEETLSRRCARCWPAVPPTTSC
ncbi:hypothetical protein SVIOM74S_04436 [Streptomyces violarus]